MPDRRHTVLGQLDLRHSTRRQKNNYKVVRDGKTGSRKHIKMDIIVTFKWPSWVRTRDQLSNTGGGFSWIEAVSEQELRLTSLVKAKEQCTLGMGMQVWTVPISCMDPTHSNATKMLLTKVLPNPPLLPNPGQRFTLQAKTTGLAPLGSSELMPLPNCPPHNMSPLSFLMCSGKHCGQSSGIYAAFLKGSFWSNRKTFVKFY